MATIGRFEALSLLPPKRLTFKAQWARQSMSGQVYFRPCLLTLDDLHEVAERAGLLRLVKLTKTQRWAVGFGSIYIDCDQRRAKAAIERRKKGAK